MCHPAYINVDTQYSTTSPTLMRTDGYETLEGRTQTRCFGCQKKIEVDSGSLGIPPSSTNALRRSISVALCMAKVGRSAQRYARISSECIRANVALISLWSLTKETVVSRFNICATVSVLFAHLYGPVFCDVQSRRLSIVDRRRIQHQSD